MRPAIVFWFLIASLGAQTGSVEGTVVNRVTGQPMSDVHVRLIGLDPEFGYPDRVHGADSDKAGHFSMTGMQPGLYIYIAAAERPGYLLFRRAGGGIANTVRVKAGQTVTDLKVEMTPRARISGRVVDEHGSPVQNIVVSLRSVSADSVPLNFPGRNDDTMTNDRGEFRIVTLPGRYHIMASLGNNFYWGRAPEVRTDGTSAAPFQSTYYPSATAVSGATAIEVGPGQDVTALELRLSRDTSESRPFNISGTVTGLPPAAFASVYVRCGETPEALNNGHDVGTDGDGKFSIPDLPPGYCRMVAIYSADKGWLQSPAVDLRLAGDHTGIVLPLATPDDLAGTLEIAGELPRGGSAQKPAVVLEAAKGPFFSNTEPVEPGPDGTFKTSLLFPSEYRVKVQHLPESAYIKSIVLNGAPAQGDTIDLSRGTRGARLKIGVALDGGQISGMVLDNDGAPLSAPLAILLVWSDPKKTEPEKHDAKLGKYDLKGLRPGKYRFLAADVLDFKYDPDASDGNDEVANKLLMGLAEEVEIKPGDRLVKDLRVVDWEKAHAKPKQ